MKIIVSPAKKMKEDADGLPVSALPVFLDCAELLLRVLWDMDAAALQKLWNCSDKIAAQNLERLGNLNLRKNLTPAIFAYEGIQYRYMAPNVFTAPQYDCLQERLRILSGFYGVLRPFDGVRPYRLEMRAKLAAGGAKDLYAFWGDRIAKQLFSETDCILNLASREYSLAVSRYLTPHIRFITCVFGEERNGRIIEKGTVCKMARGEMVRYLTECGITDPTEVRNFDHLNYHFAPEHSNECTYVFLREEKNVQI